MGPLKGLKVIEMPAIGPVPFAGMMLADMGAEVVQIERSAGTDVPRDCNRRGKSSIVLDLKHPQGVEVVQKLIRHADVLIEGFRPGVMERLGIGPDICLSINPKLVFGRMTGWGQDGPLAPTAGHDINYISVSGVLHAIGRKGQRPVPPLNLVGDYGGGALFLVTGVLAALWESEQSGRGQVVDAAMTDGSAYLMAVVNMLHAMNLWSPQRGVNMLDGGAPFYDTYETKDGKYLAVGAIEPKFFKILVEKTGLAPSSLTRQYDSSHWPELRLELSNILKTKTRDEWSDIFAGSDACVTPVLDYLEAQTYDHNTTREGYMSLNGFVQPAPAPRFNRTKSEVRHGGHPPGRDAREILLKSGFTDTEVDNLIKADIVKSKS